MKRFIKDNIGYLILIIIGVLGFMLLAERIEEVDKANTDIKKELSTQLTTESR